MRKALLIILLLFIISFPESTYCTSCYQDMLFTTKDKIDRNNDKFSGVCFKIGGNIEDIKVWKRWKFGYPFAAITTDYQPDSKIFQGRIQYDYIFVNIFLVSIILLPFYFLFLLVGKLFKDSGIFKN